jgi:hypothetical protein
MFLLERRSRYSSGPTNSIMRIHENLIRTLLLYPRVVVLLVNRSILNHPGTTTTGSLLWPFRSSLQVTELCVFTWTSGVLLLCIKKGETTTFLQRQAATLAQKSKNRTMLRPKCGTKLGDISSSSVSNTSTESARMLENSPVPFVPDIPQNIGSQSVSNWTLTRQETHHAHMGLMYSLQHPHSILVEVMRSCELRHHSIHWYWWKSSI